MSQVSKEVDKFTCIIRQYPPHWQIPPEAGKLPPLATFNFRWPTPTESNELEGLSWWITFPCLYKQKMVLPQIPVCPATTVSSTPQKQLWIQLDYKWPRCPSSELYGAAEFPGFIIEKISPLEEPGASEVDVLRGLVDKFFYLNYGRTKNSSLMPGIEGPGGPAIQQNLLSFTRKLDSLEDHLNSLSSSEGSCSSKSLSQMKSKMDMACSGVSAFQARVVELEEDKHYQRIQSLIGGALNHKKCKSTLDHLHTSLGESKSELEGLKKQDTQLGELQKEIAQVKEINTKQ